MAPVSREIAEYKTRSPIGHITADRINLEIVFSRSEEGSIYQKWFFFNECISENILLVITIPIVYRRKVKNEVWKFGLFLLMAERKEEININKVIVTEIIAINFLSI